MAFLSIYRFKKDALLYQYIPSILFAWHLIYEVFKTKVDCLVQ